LPVAHRRRDGHERAGGTRQPGGRPALRVGRPARAARRMSGGRAVAWVLCAVITAALCGWIARTARRTGSDAGPWRRALQRFHGNRAAVVALWLVVAAC